MVNVEFSCATEGLLERIERKTRIMHYGVNTVLPGELTTVLDEKTIIEFYRNLGADLMEDMRAYNNLKKAGQV